MWNILGNNSQGFSSAPNPSKGNYHEDPHLEDAELPPLLCGIYHVQERIKIGATGVLHRARVQYNNWVGKSFQGNDSMEWIDLILKIEEEGVSKQQMSNEFSVYSALSKQMLPIPSTIGGFLEARFSRHIQQQLQTITTGNDMNQINESGMTTSETKSKPTLNILATKAIGNDLGTILAASRSKKLSLKTVLSLGEQMIDLLSILHQTGYCHRDIKPENFCVGIGDKSHLLYLLDFGVARSIKQTTTPSSSSSTTIPYSTTAEVTATTAVSTPEVVPPSKAKRLVGSVRYLSLNAHKGSLADEVDDLESVAYVLLHLYRGHLPWQGLSSASASNSKKVLVHAEEEDSDEHHPYVEKWSQIAKVKSDSSLLASLNSECPAVCEFLSQIKELQQLKSTSPSSFHIDYLKLKNIFTEWRKKRGLVDDGIYEWNKLDRSTSNSVFGLQFKTSIHQTREAEEEGQRNKRTKEDKKDEKIQEIQECYEKSEEVGFKMSLHNMYEEELPAETNRQELGTQTQDSQPTVSCPTTAPVTNAPTVAIETIPTAPTIDVEPISNKKAVPPFSPPLPTTSPLRSALRTKRMNDSIHYDSKKRTKLNDQSNEEEKRIIGGNDLLFQAGQDKKQVRWCHDGDGGLLVTEYVLKGLGPASVWGLATDGGASPASQTVVDMNEEDLLSKWTKQLNKGAGIDGKSLIHKKSFKEPPSMTEPVKQATEIASSSSSSSSTTTSTTSTTSSTSSAPFESRNIGAADATTMVVTSLAKILPHLKKKEKCLKALKLFAQLLRAYTNIDTVDIITDALACSVMNARQVHQINLKDGYIDLFHTVSLSLSLYPLQNRHRVALWVIAAEVFNATTPLPSSTSTTRILNEYEVAANALKLEEWRNQFISSITQLNVLLEHMLDCFYPQQEQKNGGGGGGGGGTKGKGGVSASCEGEGALSKVPSVLFKARLYDVLMRYAENYRESWISIQNRNMILSCYEQTLRLPLTWWPQPHGRTHRTQIERTFSTLQARR